jgi:hypothetical protein
LGSIGPGNVSADNTELTNRETGACIPACTPIARDGSAVNENEKGGGDRDFGQALILIAKLPLSDSEKAEAVRRLLAASKKPADEIKSE